MIRGTTPTHFFTTNIDASELTSIMVIYAQGDNELFHKCIEDCTLDGNRFSVQLTQEETLKFDCNQKVQIQIRVLLNDGNAMASRPYVVSVEECLNDEVLT